MEPQAAAKTAANPGLAGDQMAAYANCWCDWKVLMEALKGTPGRAAIFRERLGFVEVWQRLLHVTLRMISSYMEFGSHWKLEFEYFVDYELVNSYCQFMGKKNSLEVKNPKIVGILYYSNSDSRGWSINQTFRFHTLVGCGWAPRPLAWHPRPSLSGPMPRKKPDQGRPAQRGWLVVNSYV